MFVKFGLWNLLDVNPFKFVTMKRVLGLDLGSTSIGWAVIDEYSEEIVSDSQIPINDTIVGIGSRIIPLTTDESTQFTKGQALTKNADRTARRTQRKGYDRYQMRRAMLLNHLSKLGMYSGTTLRCSTLQLWGLRAKAVSEQLSLLELGRVLCHINQKRGYRTVKSDYGDKKSGEYVQSVVNRYRELHDLGVTVGQYLYNSLCGNSAFRCKDRVYPRDAYVEEFDAIMRCQQEFYPQLLTDAVILLLRDGIIFHQRPLKSCKHLISKCELERCDVEVNGRVYNHGPRVAPRSSPLFQLCKIWEAVNNISIHNKFNDKLYLTLEQKQEIVKFMCAHPKLKAADLKSILKLKGREWIVSRAVGSGLQGDTTYCAIADALADYPQKGDLLRFEITYTDGRLVDTQTGEITKIVSAQFESQPLYRLWHALYSISDIEELKSVLNTKFNIDNDDVIERLCQIDFVKSGYGNKSSRAMRKILPYLQQGMDYYNAKLAAGYNDVPLNSEQNECRELADALTPVQKGELRQPVVEKILNQLVNLVNALMEEYGHFDEIRVELARDLKQSREERETSTKRMNETQRENEKIANRIKDEYGLTPTRSRIQKFKMWDETGHICIYCGQTVCVKDFLEGSGVEVEHIIPRSLLFDDSFNNKSCSCRRCNQEKGNRTAYDFMKSRGDGEFTAYTERVNSLAEGNKIQRAKQKRLLMSAADIPSDFIDRQLRESQYIAKKARLMLQSVCRNVYATSGSVTDFIRHLWGWDEVLHTLNFKRYQDAGLTEMVDRDVDGKVVQVERIAGWNKRMDHRHHAIDALTIACTKQGYIQRINNLNSLKEVAYQSFKNEEQGEDTRTRLTRLERYIKMQPHFTTAEVTSAVERIAVSFKSGKRATSPGKRYVRKGGKRVCVQRGVIVPRGALSEESVYGRIHSAETGRDEIVIKYKIGAIDLKKAKDIVDSRIRAIVIERLEQFGGKPEKAFAEPLLDHQSRQIRSVRCYTGLSAVVPLRRNEQGKEIAFVKPGNNHHVAIYEDQDGKWQEHVSTFWHAVERKKYGLPIIIKNLEQLWDSVTDEMPEAFVNQLPASATWKFKFSMQQNEMFILGMEEELYQDAMAHEDYALLSKYLYRVQKLTSGAYVFRKHIETQTDDRYVDEAGKKVFSLLKSRQLNAVHWISCTKALQELNPHKVHISVMGKITEI